MNNFLNLNLKIVNFIKLFVKGFCMGIANVIPGISGGTIAFILGIYEELISSIKSIDLQFFRLLIKFRIKEAINYLPWKFLSAIAFGALTAIISLARVLTWLLENKPVFINSFFFGLIVATIPIIALVIKKWTIPKITAAIIAFVFTYSLSKVTPVTTPDAAWFIFLCGVIAISTMILPGISGSFILKFLGKYSYILEAINQRNLYVLAVFSIGAFVGLISFVRVLSWLFKKYHDLTVSALTGIVVGSLSKIWPWKETIRFIESHSGKSIPIEQINIIPQKLDLQVIYAILFIVVGFAAAMLLNFSSGKSNTASFKLD